MRNIVYLLNAGFSAPLGLPTISTFYWKAKDLYESEPAKFAHFSKSFALMDSFGRLKTFMKADLENIEEILSILEMAEALSSEPSSQPFSKFISDVIVACTPEIPAPQVHAEELEPNTLRFFGKNPLLASYCVFVAQLLALRLPRVGSTENGHWNRENRPLITQLLILITTACLSPHANILSGTIREKLGFDSTTQHLRLKPLPQMSCSPNCMGPLPRK